MLAKCVCNPLITVDHVAPSQPGLKVLGVFNAGATLYNGEVVLLLRVAEAAISGDNVNIINVPVYDIQSDKINILELDNKDKAYDTRDPRVIKSPNGKNYLTSISHLRLARSRDGIEFEIEAAPFIKSYNAYTSFGVEDARITQVNDVYYINYSATSNYGIVTCLSSTKDFKSVSHHGNIFHPDNKDVAIFPDSINNLYYALHRPSTSEYGMPNMWLASSNDLIRWGDHRLIAEVRPGQWDSERIGASCIPILTKRGWLEIYHGATKENVYCLGAMLLDKDEPWRILSRSEGPILVPAEPYETSGFFGNVVFSCGAVVKGDMVYVYYGASDDCVCLASASLDDILNGL